MTTLMRGEIEEQPAALRRTLDGLRPLIPEIAALGRETRQVLFIGRGSSDNAAVYGRYLAEVRCGRLATLASPSVATVYRGRLDLDGVLAVALSQSGRTEEIVETLDWARDCGARTVAVTNATGSPLAEVADLTLVTGAGTERAVPATKTYVTQLGALACLALGLGGADDLAEPLARVPDEIERMVAKADAAEALAAELAGAGGLVVSGRGFAFSTALELALKFEEACYVPAIGLSYADLLHGPIAVLDADTPALLVSPDEGAVVSDMRVLADRVTSVGVPVYAIGGGVGLAGVGRTALAGPALPEELAPLGLVVPGQLAAEALARRLGIDPDRPRGLGKVTQTSPGR
ncbi:MAG: SIS domain-containing protein [Streptosporangiaceae bacterium]